MYWPLKNMQEQQGQFNVFRFGSVRRSQCLPSNTACERQRLMKWWSGKRSLATLPMAHRSSSTSFCRQAKPKWAVVAASVVLLRHGYEGRPGAFIGTVSALHAASAEFNGKSALPSNAAQVYHMLRAMLRKQRKPLIVMTPKSLLRHRECREFPRRLAMAPFQTIIRRNDKFDAKKVTRMVTCAGKVYFELLAARREAEDRQRSPGARRAALSLLIDRLLAPR